MEKFIYEGECLNGKRNGKGKEYSFNKELLFKGEYLDGKRWNGKGKEYSCDGELLFEGEYINGKKWNGIERKFYNNKLQFEFEYLNGIKIIKLKNIFTKVHWYLKENIKMRKDEDKIRRNMKTIED